MLLFGIHGVESALASQLYAVVREQMKKTFIACLVAALFTSCVSTALQKPEENLISFNLARHPTPLLEVCSMFNSIRNITAVAEFTEDSLSRDALQEIKCTVVFERLPAQDAFRRIMKNVNLTGTAYTNGTYRITRSRTGTRP